MASAILRRASASRAASCSAVSGGRPSARGRQFVGHDAHADELELFAQAWPKVSKALAEGRALTPLV